MKAKLIASGISRMPFSDADYAVQASLNYMISAPIWPQIPKPGVNGQMEIQ